MADLKSNNIIRSALLAAYNNSCFYCQRPLEFDDLEVDHIIPANYGNDIRKLNLLKEEYSLQPEFDTESLFNLVPAHTKCNLRKSGDPLSKSASIYFLEMAAKKIPRLEREIEKLRNRRNRGTILSKSRAALADGLIDITEFERIIREAKETNWHSTTIKIPVAVEFIDEVFDSFYLNTDCSVLYDKTLLIGKSFTGLELINENEESKTVSTLREWKMAKKQGFFAATTFAMKMADCFTFLDDLIKALHDAIMPKASFISEPWLGIDNLEYLSPNFILSMDGCQPEFDSSTSVSDLIKKGIIKKKDAYNFQVALEFQGMEILLIEQFRADFNHDGIEDIFVRTWTRAVGGSFGMGHTCIFTRRSEKALIEAITI